LVVAREGEALPLKSQLILKEANKMATSATSSVSQSVSSLLAQTAPYKVTASVGGDEENGYGFGGATYTGDTTSDIWKPTNEMGKDQFLHLLTIQLKYQDPLDPMDNSAFVSQLAQFRALETQENTESAIRELGKAFDENLASQMYASQSISNASAMSLIGRDVRMIQEKLSWDGKDGNKIPINVHLGNAVKGDVEITDSEGNVIRTIAASGKDAQNSVTVYWDGKTDDGEKAKVGTYGVRVKGGDKDLSLYPYVQEVVEGVRFSNDGVMVKIAGKEIPINGVLDVSLDGSGGGYINQSSALSLMGKTVRARHTSIQHSAVAGAEHQIKVNASRGTEVSVQIKNVKGDVVATVKGTASEFGTANLFWDGRNSIGEMAPAGTYTINVVGSDKNTSIYAYTEGVVDGLTSLSGDFKLKIGSTEIALNDIISISAKGSIAVPTNPTTVRAAPESANSARITWDAVPDAAGYTVYFSTSLNGTYNPLTTTPSTSFTDTGLSADKTYYYKVSAYNSSGEGGMSTVAAEVDMSEWDGA
jgi:flagellar basal-body rod modification protein FlgD